VFPDAPWAPARGSFQSPVPVPLVDPDTSPTTTVTLSCAWLPYVRGALQQLLLQATWNTDNPSVLLLAQQRAFNLIDLFQECPGGSVPFSCPFDFSRSGAGDDGFLTPDNAGWAPLPWGTLLDGTGWISTESFDAGGDLFIDAIHIKKTFGTAVHMNAVQCTFNLTKGTVAPGVFSYLEAGLGGTAVADDSPEADTVPDGFNTFAVSFADQLIDYIDIRIVCGIQSASSPGGACQLFGVDYNVPGGGCTGGE